MWPPVSLWGCLSWHECLEPPNLSHTDTTDEDIDAELLSLWNPRSDENKGDQGGATHNSWVCSLDLGLTSDEPDEG